MVQSFFVPGLIPSLNELLRARSVMFGKGKFKGNAYNEMKKDWALKVRLLSMNLKQMPNGAHFRFTFYEKDKARDPDDFISAGHKFILDALTKGRGKKKSALRPFPWVIPDDGWAGVLSIRDEWAVVRSTQNEVGILVELSDDGEFE